MAGRPKLEFDYEELRKLGELQCTYAEIAAFFGCHVDTIRDRTKTDEEFSNALLRGYEQGKMSLRRYQWRSAQKGNVKMLIWLGKQYLGQRDIPKEDEDNGALDKLVNALDKRLEQEAATGSE